MDREEQKKKVMKYLRKALNLPIRSARYGRCVQETVKAILCRYDLVGGDD